MKTSIDVKWQAAAKLKRPIKTCSILLLFFILHIYSNVSFAQIKQEAVESQLPNGISVPGVKLSGGDISGKALVAYGNDNKVYTFQYDGYSWNQTYTITGVISKSTEKIYDVAYGERIIVVGIYDNTEDYSNNYGKLAVYTFNGSGYTRTATLKASDEQPGDYFGVSVAADGNRIVTSAPLHSKQNNDGPSVEAGAVYVYDYNGSKWLETKFETGSEYTYFGEDFDLSGDRIIISEGFGTNVHIYEYKGSSWQHTYLFGAFEDIARNYSAVAISGDYAIVGDPQTPPEEWDTNLGYVSVYKYSNNNWSKVQKISPPENDTEFGSNVFLSGKNMIIYAANGEDADTMYTYILEGSKWKKKDLFPDPSESSSAPHVVTNLTGDIMIARIKSDANALYSFDFSQYNQQPDNLTLSVNGVKLVNVATDGERAIASGNNGSVYIFAFDGTAWNLTKTISGFPNTETDRIFDISISGNLAVVSVYSIQDEYYRNGKAYVYEFDGFDWTKTATLQASDDVPDNSFGYPIVIEGKRIVIGASGNSKEEGEVIEQAGAVYIYDQMMNNSWKETKISSPMGDYAFFGETLDLSGNQLIVGAGFSDNTYIYKYNGSGWDGKLLENIPGTVENSFGTSVAISGNYAIAGDPGESGVEDDVTASGYVYVYKYTDHMWRFLQKLTPSEEVIHFGSEVFIEGNQLFINADNQDRGVSRVYAFSLEGNKWVEDKLFGHAPESPNAPTSVTAYAGDIMLARIYSDANGYHSFIYPQPDQQQFGDGDANDNLGNAVAISGEYAAGGAFKANNKGGAYSYEKYGANWSQTKILTASDAANGDRFGISVDTDGQRTIVGAHQNDDAGSSSGAAYIYDKYGAQRAKLVASDAKAYHRFGYAVGISNSYAVVGSPYDNLDGKNNAGSIYVFSIRNNQWTQIQKIIAPDAKAGDYFGWSVAISGKWMVVGSKGDDDFGGDSGSAYVYLRVNGKWELRQKINAKDAKGSDRFGTSVNIDVNTIIVGAPMKNGSGDDSGAAYIFTVNNEVWEQQGKLVASDAAALDRFGSAVSISKNKAVVGSPYDDNTNGTNSGSIYVFKYENNAWTETRKILAETGNTGDKFGTSVDMDGDNVIAGANLYDQGSNKDAGTVYFYNLATMPNARFNTSDIVSKKVVEPAEQKAVEKTLFNKEFSVYPNPVEDDIHIQFGSITDNLVNLSLSDASGRLISSQKSIKLANTEGQLSIGAGNLKPGVYYLRIESGQGEPKVIRILKK